MYRLVPTVLERLFTRLNAEFGAAGRGYFSTFEKGLRPRRGDDLVPALFPWAYLDVEGVSGRLTRGEFYRSGRNGWYQLVISLYIIGFSKDADISTLITNPDFDRERPSAALPGLADMAGEVMSYMYTNYKTPSSIVQSDSGQVVQWDASGIGVTNNLILRSVMADAQSSADYLRAWQVNFNFDIIERFCPLPDTGI